MNHSLTSVELLPGGCLQVQHGGLHTNHLPARTCWTWVEPSHKGNPAREETANPGFILCAHPCLLDWGALKHKAAEAPETNPAVIMMSVLEMAMSANESVKIILPTLACSIQFAPHTRRMYLNAVK